MEQLRLTAVKHLDRSITMTRVLDQSTPNLGVFCTVLNMLVNPAVNIGMAWDALLYTMSSVSASF